MFLFYQSSSSLFFVLNFWQQTMKFCQQQLFVIVKHSCKGIHHRPYITLLFGIDHKQDFCGYYTTRYLGPDRQGGRSPLLERCGHSKWGYYTKRY